MNLLLRGCGLLALLCACGPAKPAQLSIRSAIERPDNDARSIAAIQKDLNSSQQLKTAPCGALVTVKDGGQLRIAWLDPNLNKIQKLSHVVPESRPQLLAGLAITMSQGDLVAVELASREIRFRAAMPLPVLVGSASNKTSLFVVTRSKAEPYRYALSALSLEGGKRFIYFAEGPLGEPIATDHYVLVPHLGQSLVALDAVTGREVARVRRDDDVMAWIVRSDKNLLFGDRHVSMLSEHYDGCRDSVLTMDLPLAELPGRPTPFPSAYIPVPAARTAHGRIGIYFRPAEHENSLALQHDTLYYVFYRHVYGLDSNGRVRFARRLDHEVVYASAIDEGLVLLDDHGRILRIQAQDGALQAWMPAHPQAVTSGVLNNGQQCHAGNNLAAPAPLLESLSTIVNDPDSRLLMSRLFALEQLVKLNSPDITRELLAVIENPRSPAPLVQAARNALLTQHSGSEVLLAALDQHYDYVQGTLSPPVDVIAEALAAQSTIEAVPKLQQRLFDYATPMQSLPSLARALAILSPRVAANSLERLLSRYRADSSFASDPQSYLSLIQIWLEVDTTTAHAQIEHWAKEESSQPVLRAALQTWLAQENVALASLTSDEHGETDPNSATPALPYLVAQQELWETLQAQRDDWLPCLQPLREHLPDLQQFRMAMVVNAQGESQHRHYLPNDEKVSRCLNEKLAKYRFPKSRTARQLAVFTVELKGREDLPPVPDPAQQPWWFAYMTTAKSSTTKTRPIPWWQDQNPVIISVEPDFEQIGAPNTPSNPTNAYSDAPRIQDEASHEPSSPTDAWWMPNP